MTNVPVSAARHLPLTIKRPKILLAPMNIANMPMQVVNGLRQRGYEAAQIQYTFGSGHAFGYQLDREVNIKALGGRIAGHAATLRSCLEEDFDIFHFWNKSLFYEGQYNHLTGLDLPMIKAREKKIVYRFTGYDARLPSRDKAVNRFSPFNEGLQHFFDEAIQIKYLEFLEEYVDQFVVQDPEMGQFAPDNTVVVPRSLNLQEWAFEGVQPTDRPLVVHAPSRGPVKGTSYVLAAVEKLRAKGVKFDFKLVQGMQHADAKALYRKADIIVDQLMIGATGVLTLEAWALGKPCVVFLREELFKPFYQTSELPIANANPATITDVLERLIKDWDWRQELSRRGRETVERFHDNERVIDQYVSVYQKVFDAPSVRPSGFRDIAYLETQATKSQKFAIQARQYRTRLEGQSEIADPATPITETGRQLVVPFAPRELRLLLPPYLRFRHWVSRMLRRLRRP